MPSPKDFSQTDETAIDALINENPLAQIVAQGSDGLIANAIPLIKRGDRLIGHIALANSMHERIVEGAAVIAIFMGVQGYISPNWYPSKADTHRVVPTWNYETVQIHGHIHWHHDNKRKRAAVGLLTTQMERAVKSDDAWKMADAPADYLDGMLDNIVAFEIAITKIDAKSKLSQNKSRADRGGVVDGLHAAGQADLAEAVKRTQDG